MNFNDRISALRLRMKECGVDIFMSTTEDAYLAENAVDYWRSLKWLTGFTGTLAYAIITQDRATFWTDARYAIKAPLEVLIDGIELYDVTRVGADYYLDWITDTLSAMPDDDLVFAVDGRTITTARGALIADALKRVEGKTCTLRSDLDLIGDIWTDRPDPVYNPIFEHKLKYAGRSRKEKLADLRRALAIHKADHTIVGTMEGVAWLTNMRGQDLINPVFMSHVLVTPDEAKLFAKVDMIPIELQKKLADDGYMLYDIDQIRDVVSGISPDAVVYCDRYRLNYRLFSAIPKKAKIIFGFDLVNNLKAIKNDVEIRNFIHSNNLESVALFRFSQYLKAHVAEGNLDEYNVRQIIHDFRCRSDEYLDRGKPARRITAAYMENGAGPHYTAIEGKCAMLRPSGVVLVDDTCNYYGGSIDVTRTYYLGPCEYDEELKHDYTLTLRSLMELERQVFRKGADGAFLDSVARRVMWNERLHYGYGTGHGIGYCLGAHEGPQFIAEPSYKKEWAFCFLPFEKNMVTSIEPGVYKKGCYGIRLEDDVYVAEDTVNEFGEFYCFRTMSYNPFERELINISMLRDDEIEWINAFHSESYCRLSPYLNEDEKTALAKITAPLVR